MKDRIGKAIGYGATGRVMALFWLFAAVLAMPMVASAQIVASRSGASRVAGDVSGAEGGVTDAALSRHAIRAAPPADLRFTAERTDAKPLPGGPDPFLLPFPLGVEIERLTASTNDPVPSERPDARPAEAAKARAPPLAA